MPPKPSSDAASSVLAALQLFSSNSSVSGIKRAAAGDASTSSAAAASSTAAPSTPKTTANAANGSGNGKQKESKRRKVTLACVYCRRSHMTCDDSRPCKRCIKRDIGHLCHDRPPSATKPIGSKANGAEASADEEGSSHSPATAVDTSLAGASSFPSTSFAPAGPQDLLKLSRQHQQQQPSPARRTSQTSGEQLPSSSQTGAGSSGYPNLDMTAGSPEGDYPNLSLGQLLPRQGAAGGSGGSTADAFNASANGNGSGNANGVPGQQAGQGASVGQGILLGPSTAASVANQLWASSFRTGLGSASWLGLGGGPTSLDADGTAVTQGDSAGGNEFNILSEFLESLDGGALLTPGAPSAPVFQGGAGASGNQGGASSPAYANIAGVTPSQTASAMKLDTDELVNLDGMPSTAGAPTGADAAADVHSNLSDLEKTGQTPRGHRRNLSSRGGGIVNGMSGITSAAPTPAAVATAPTPTPAMQSVPLQPSTSTQGSAGPFQAPTPGATGASGSVMPALNWASKTERFFLTAADQKDGTRDERLGKVIQAKYEAGLLRPYNHVNGYARLNRWMERNVSPASRRRILKPLSVFRPAFRAVAQSLTNIDLIYIEEAFERLLLDYDRVFSTQGIPACLWRRTGEIYKGNKEFAELVGVQIDALREGRLCIYELMAEESAVNYWEKYGAVSFDPGQKAVLTTCVLRTRNPPRQQKVIPAALAVAAQLPRLTQMNMSGDVTPQNGPAALSATNSQQQPPNAANTNAPGNPAGVTVSTNSNSNALQPTPAPGAASSPAPPPAEAATPAPSTAAGGLAPASTPGAAAAQTPVARPSSVKSTADNANPSAPTMPKRDSAGFVEIKCCFSFTIRRDQWNIPTMIVGNFLPCTPSQ